MKRSEVKSKSLIYLAVYTIFVLILPNVLLDFTEVTISVVGKILNVLFPLGMYLLIVAVFRRTGIGVLCCFPFMLFAAFQLVLLYLYGESIIAVDMFLNVVTTDFEEASTLLQNLTPAILLVAILYLPPIVWSIMSLRRKKFIPQFYRLIMIITSLCLIVSSGVILLISSLCSLTQPNKDIFPVNVINNLCTAVKRGKLARQYPESAAGFTYEAFDADGESRIVVLVIGETSRSDHWALFGAERPTNPCLSRRDNLYIFERAVTQSNTTHKSVPMLLTPLSAETFDSLNNYKSIITAFKEAGFQTYWLTNQPPNGAYNEHMGYEADTSVVMKYVPDVELVAEADKLLEKSDPNRSRLIVLHTYGAHFPYDERYKGYKPTFVPDGPVIANKANKKRLVNAYDNAIVASDLAIDSMIKVVGRYSDNAVLIYASDHGEDLFDDYREKFLHASPAPTVYQLRVPMFVWMSDYYNMKNQLGDVLKVHRKTPLSPSVSLFHTVIDLGKINTKYYNPVLSVASEQFDPYPLLYLTDRNEAVPLVESGLRNIDIQQLDSLGILRFSKH